MEMVSVDVKVAATCVLESPAGLHPPLISV